MITDITPKDGERLDEVNESIRLLQKKNGLTFGTDAYLLAAYMYSHCGGTAVELGGGTGIISLLAASKKRFEKISIVEIQEEYAELIKRNIKINNLCDRLDVCCKDVRDLKAVDFGNEADAVFSNPPYMKTDSGKRNECDGKYIARHEVFGGIDDFCACANRLLKHGGKFYTVWRPDRLADLVCALRQHHLEVKQLVFVHATPQSQPSVVLVQSTKGAAAGNTVFRPLFLHDSAEDAKNNVLSTDAAAIYSNCSFDEFI